MEINKDKLFNALVEICKNNSYKEVSIYYNNTCGESLSSYATLISTQSDFFYPQSIYFADENEKILYVEKGWAKGACQILLQFNKNIFHYDSYEFPDDILEYQDVENGNISEDEFWKFWDSWNSKHDISINGSIWDVLKAFSKNNNVFEKIVKDNFSQKSDVDNVVEDFIYRINDTDKLANIDENDLKTFIKGVDGRLDIYTVDTRIKIVSIEKVIIDGNEKYKFIVDIINENGESFNIKSFIENKDQLKTLISTTADTLRQYEQFSKYSEDLENCL